MVHNHLLKDRFLLRRLRCLHLLERKRNGEENQCRFHFGRLGLRAFLVRRRGLLKLRSLLNRGHGEYQSLETLVYGEELPFLAIRCFDDYDVIVRWIQLKSGVFEYRTKVQKGDRQVELAVNLLITIQEVN